MFFHSQFLEGYVILNSLSVIWKFLVIIIKSSPFILANFHVCWHVSMDYFLRQFSDLVMSLHHRQNVHLKICHSFWACIHDACILWMQKLHVVLNFPTFVKCLISNSSQSFTFASSLNINALPIDATNLLIINSLCVCFFARMMERQCN